MPLECMIFYETESDLMQTMFQAVVEVVKDIALPNPEPRLKVIKRQVVLLWMSKDVSQHVIPQALSSIREVTSSGSQ